MEYNWTGSWFASVVDFLPFPLGSPPVSYRLCLFEMVIDFTIQSFKLCTNKKIKLHWHKFFFYVIGLSERWLFLLNYLLITVPLRPSFTWMIRFHWGIVICVCCNPGKAVGIQKIERKQRCTSYKRSKCGRNWKQMEKEPRGPGCQIKNERSQTFRRNKFLEGRGEQNRVW